MLSFTRAFVRAFEVLDHSYAHHVCGLEELLGLLDTNAAAIDAVTAPPRPVKNSISVQE